MKQTENGLCLIVGIKNRIKGDLSVYDALTDPECNYGDNLDESIENLVGRKFLPDGSSKSKVIYDIDTERKPINTSKNYGKESYKNYIEFFKKEFNKEIKDVNQPMILVKVKGPEGEQQFNYYVPEFCKLCGVNELDIQDFKFMNELAEYTKLDPDEKIAQINKCLDLFKDKTERIQEGHKDNEKKEEEKKEEKKENKKNKKKRRKKKEEKEEKEEDEKEENKINEEEDKNKNKIIVDKNNTSDKKREFYGIEISKLDNIQSYHIIQPTFNNEEDKDLDLNSIFPVARENISTSQWLCVYNKSLEDKTYDLLQYFEDCQEAIGILLKNDNSNWISMKNDDAKDWKKEVESEIKKRNNKVKFVIFLISKKNNHLYEALKKHSLTEKGYISQFIKIENLNKIINKSFEKRKKNMVASYISKILTKINCKLGGANYLLNLDKITLDRKIMFIGIDFGLNASHTWKRRQQGVMSMVATKDKYYSKFYAQNEILQCKEKNYVLTIQENISNFIDIAINKYVKEENSTPKNIIIYRQGISEYQIESIKNEIKIIEEICQKKGIKYYYVIVNTKTSLKFFESNIKKTKKETGTYKNPEPGLIVLNQVTDKNKFEFYIQPQKVTQGSATPTFFRAIYGDMDFPELLIKLTYWTTYIYPNWQSSVRIPHVLKIAEKYSYKTAKVTRKRNKDNLEDFLSAI